MDYKKAYKDALERARKCLDEKRDTCFVRPDVIFPELQESEDERIKNRLIHLIKMSSEVGGFALHKWEADEMLTWLEKQSEQKFADKTEPKFKVCDWIINKSHDICLITDIDIENGYYICESNRFGNTDGDIDLTDKAFHLWTVADAKEGDVLAFDNSQIILVKESHNSTWGWRLSCWCHLLDREFEIVEYHTKTEGLHPATKEQRELLFQKMKEAGYEWDAEKKELRKIEKQGEQKAKWSEEDEKNLSGIIDEIQANKSTAPNYDIETYDMFLSWLKQLKQRMI